LDDNLEKLLMYSVSDLFSKIVGCRERGVSANPLIYWMNTVVANPLQNSYKGFSANPKQTLDEKPCMYGVHIVRDAEKTR
jgi:hypothetical protein